MIPAWLSFIDMAFVGVALFFAFGGYQRGFAGQVAHVAALVIMGVTLFFAYPALFRYFGRVIREANETYLMWLIMVGLAVGVFILFVVISKMLARLLKTQFSERADKIYGFSLGFLRGALVALLAMILLVMLGPSRIYDDFRMKSRMGQLVCYEMVPRIQPHFSRDSVESKVQGLKNRLLERKDGGFIP